MLTKLMPAARVKVLAFLLLNASEELHLREIARRAGVPLQAAQRELALLEEIALGRAPSARPAGLRERTDIAPAVRGSAFAAPQERGPRSPPSAGAGGDRRRRGRRRLRVGGRWVRHRPQRHRPVGRGLARRARCSTRPSPTLEEELGRPINYTLLSRKELKARLRKKDPFLNRVLAGDLIPVIGAIDED